MLSFSTGLLNAIIGERGFGSALYGGVVRIYSGQRPASANDAIPAGAVEIARITEGGRVFYPGADSENAGLKFRISGPGELQNDGTWILTGIGSGAIKWFRWNWGYADLNQGSTLLPRLDGDAGPSAANDLVIPFESVFLGQKYMLDFFVAKIGPI